MRILVIFGNMGEGGQNFEATVIGRSLRPALSLMPSQPDLQLRRRGAR